MFGLYPAVPHHLVYIVGILRNTHSICNATGTVVRLAAMVGVGIREYNFYTTTAHTGACTWAFHIVIVPAAHHLDGKRIHVVVVIKGRGITVEWAIAFLVVRVTLLVPILAQTLVATVFHRPHGVFFALVDIQHLATILGFVDIQHLATADSTSAVGVVSIANLLHLNHVFATDTLVTALVEQDRGIVAVIDDGIAHQGCSLLPARPLHIFLGIACRHGLDETHTVARLDILFPRGYVHPAH